MGLTRSFVGLVEADTDFRGSLTVDDLTGVASDESVRLLLELSELPAGEVLSNVDAAGSVFIGVDFGLV